MARVRTFLLAGMLSRFIYLHFGLAAILGITGAKMLLSKVVEIPTVVSLVMIASILVLSLGASLIATRRRGPLPETTPPEPGKVREETRR